MSDGQRARSEIKKSEEPSMTELTGGAVRRNATCAHAGRLSGPSSPFVSTSFANDPHKPQQLDQLDQLDHYHHDRMSTSTTKARHYAALGGRIRSLNTTIAETDSLMGELSSHLLHMQQFAACHAAQ